MKRCPTCHRTYPDEAQNFCLEDGTTLVSESPSPQSYDNRSAPTEVMYPSPTATNRVAPPTAPPNAPYIPYPAQKKSSLPWILGGLGLLVVGIAVTLLLLNRSSSTGTTASGSPGVPTSSPTSTPVSTPTTPVSTQTWQPLNGDKFNINMPGTPTKSEQTETTAVGPVQIHMYTLDNGSEGYVVGYSEYPSFVFSQRDADTLLDGARDGAVKNVKGEVLSEHPMSLGKYVGREITGKSPENNFAFTSRLYLANPRMYMLIYLRKGDQPISDDGKKFLDSFEIESQ